MEQQPTEIYSWILFLVKIVAFFSTAAFGVLGTIKDSKTKDGEVTRWGRIAVAGVIISGVVSVLTLTLEETAKSAKERNEETIKSAEKKKNDENNIIAQQKANDDKRELNSQFDKLVQQASENIEKTDEVLLKTKRVAEDVQKSVGIQEGIVKDQQGIIEKTGEISENVKKNIDGQNQVLSRTEKINYSLNKSAIQQNDLLAGNNELLTGMKTQLASTSDIINSQNELRKNSLRLLAPLKSTAVAYTIKLNLNDKNVRTYFEKLSKVVKEFVPETERENGYYTDYIRGITAIILNGELIEFRFNGSSSIFPSLQTTPNTEEHSIAKLLDDNLLTLNFNQSNNSLEIIAQRTLFGGSELFVDIKNDFQGNSSIKRRIIIDENEKSVYLMVYANSSKWIDNSGKFISFIDLPSSWLTIDLPNSSELTEFVLMTGVDYNQKLCFAVSNQLKRKVIQTVTARSGSKNKISNQYNVEHNLLIYKVSETDITPPCSVEPKKLAETNYFQ